MSELHLRLHLSFSSPLDMVLLVIKIVRSKGEKEVVYGQAKALQH